MMTEATQRPSSDDTAIDVSPNGRFLKYKFEVGRGSFKTVYKGLDTESGVPVAWCEIHQGRGVPHNQSSRNREEAEILKRLRHPNIVNFIDLWERSDGSLVIVTELLESGSLKAYIRRFTTIKERCIRNWGRQILKGLYFLHTRSPPIIHRDLKCDNIFIHGTTGILTIGDLGLATVKKFCLVHSLVGTPEFMAPEMYEESYDESVDVYAFGMVLLEMVTGMYPYSTCKYPAQIFKRVIMGSPPDELSQVTPGVLKSIIQGCTAFHKQDRFTAKDLLGHVYFEEICDIHLELVHSSKPEMKETDSAMVHIKMCYDRPNPRRRKVSGSSVELLYDQTINSPASFAQKLAETGYILESETNQVSRMIISCLASHREKAERTGPLLPVHLDRDAAKSTSDSKLTDPKCPSHNSTLASLHLPFLSDVASPISPDDGSVSKDTQGIVSKSNADSDAAPGLHIQPVKPTAYSEETRNPVCCSPWKVDPIHCSGNTTSDSIASEVLGLETADPMYLQPYPNMVSVGYTETSPNNPYHDPGTQHDQDFGKNKAASSQHGCTLRRSRKNSLVSPPHSKEVLSLSPPPDSREVLSSNPPTHARKVLSSRPLPHSNHVLSSGPAPHSRETHSPTQWKSGCSFRLKVKSICDGVATCLLRNASGVMITFKFGLEEDLPEDTGANLVKLGYLQASDLTLFVEMLHRWLRDHFLENGSSGWDSLSFKTAQVSLSVTSVQEASLNASSPCLWSDDEIDIDPMSFSSAGNVDPLHTSSVSAAVSLPSFRSGGPSPSSSPFLSLQRDASPRLLSPTIIPIRDYQGPNWIRELTASTEQCVAKTEAAWNHMEDILRMNSSGLERIALKQAVLLKILSSQKRL